MKINEKLNEIEHEVLKIMNVSKVLKLATIAPDYTNKTLDPADVESVADIIFSLASDTAMKIAEIYPISKKDILWR